MEIEKLYQFIWAKKPCQIHNSYIRPIDRKSEWTFYDPFELLVNENEKILYLKFAALTTHEDILQFISEYGFLGTHNKFNKRFNVFHTEKGEHLYELVEDIEREVRRMLLLVRVWEGLTLDNKNVDELENDLKELELLLINQDPNFTRSFFGEGESANSSLEWIYPFNVAARAISMEVNRQLAGISNGIEWSWGGNRFYSKYIPDTLLTALYVMFQQDLIRGAKIKKCKNITCKEYFKIYGKDDRKIYCNKTCASQQMQREYRRRKKVEKEENKHAQEKRK